MFSRTTQEFLGKGMFLVTAAYTVSAPCKFVQQYEFILCKINSTTCVIKLIRIHSYAVIMYSNMWFYFVCLGLRPAMHILSAPTEHFTAMDWTSSLLRLDNSSDHIRLQSGHKTISFNTLSTTEQPFANVYFNLPHSRVAPLIDHTYVHQRWLFPLMFLELFRVFLTNSQVNHLSHKQQYGSV